MHNIVGSEADRPGAHVIVRQIPRPRRSVGFVLAFHLWAVVLGVACGLVDVFVVGRPLAIVLVLIGLLAWRFWPTRR